MENQLTAPPPDSDSTLRLNSEADSDADLRAASERLEAKRRELGIRVDQPAPKPLATTLEAIGKRIIAAPVKEPEPDDADERETERRRASWKALCERECEGYLDVSLRSFEISQAGQRAVVDAVSSYIGGLKSHRERGQGFVFFGPCGSGKDHLAMVILKAAAIHHGYGLRRINGPEWFGKLRDLMDQDSSSEAAEVRDVASPDYLLISDPLPPKGPLSDYQAAMLYRVLERRQANGRPTIVTMNAASRDEIDTRMGVPTADRIMARCVVAACSWPSYRQPLSRVNF